MTDKEKAENFVKENCCEFCINKDDCEMGYIDCNTKDGVLYGLAEGRKEKHIAIIKGISRQNQKNAELKAQNKDLCESLDIMNNRESELLEQIEKMKCCGNCMNRGLKKDDISYPCCECKFYRRIKKNDFWEVEK